MLAQQKTLCGVVVSAGKMMKAVKVRTAKQVYNSFLKKVCYPPLISKHCGHLHIFAFPQLETFPER